MTDPMITRLSQWLDYIGMWWCRWQHKRISRPVHGVYMCWICGRRYKGPWE